MCIGILKYFFLVSHEEGDEEIPNVDEEIVDEFLVGIWLGWYIETKT